MKRSYNLREVKLSRSPKGIVIRLAVLAFIIYFIVTLVNQQIQLNNKKEEIAYLNSQQCIWSLKNEEMKKVLNSSDDENKIYIEKIAREKLGLVNPGECVFVNIAGN